MVGVGGRSKACDNCRRRHLKCDLARPICRRCTKAHLQCGGPRDIAIISYEHRRGTTVPSIQASNSERPWLSDGSPYLHLAKSLVSPPDDVYTAFTHSNLLHGSEEIKLPPGINRTITGECFLALSTTYFGLKHQDKMITARGLLKYGGALRIVHEALAKDDASRSFDLLEAVMIMALIEFLISEREHGWINHARGLERLLERRGPERMTSLPALLLLEKCRATMIFAAIVTCNTTIVARPEWKSLPWSQHAGRVNLLKLLTDVLADCPELFVLRGRIEQSSPIFCDQHLQVQSLLCKNQDVLNRLYQWEREWGLGVNDAYTEVSSPTTTPVVPDPSGMPAPVWSTIFHYKSLYHANALTLYHAALVLVLRFLSGVNLALNNNDESEALQAQIRDAGLAICRSVDYHLTQTWTELGSFNVLFPLRMAYEAVGREVPAIGAWLTTVLDDIAAGRRGLWKSAQSMFEV